MSIIANRHTAPNFYFGEAEAGVGGAGAGGDEESNRSAGGAENGMDETKDP